VLKSLRQQFGSEMLAVGVDLLPSGNGTWDRFLPLDLTDADAITHIEDVRPDAIVHLAAVTGQEAEKDTLRTLALNVDASLALLELSIKHKCSFVFASSIAAIGSGAGRTEADESTHCQPTSAYGRSKRVVERHIIEARRSGHTVRALRLPTLMPRLSVRAGPPTAGYLSDLCAALNAGSTVTSPMPLNFSCAVAGVGEAGWALARLVRPDVPETLPAILNLPAIPASAQSIKEVAEFHGAAGVISEPDHADPIIEKLCGAWPTGLVSDYGPWLGIDAGETPDQRLRRILVPAFSQSLLKSQRTELPNP
jgi:hypothetical protein